MNNSFCFKRFWQTQHWLLRVNWVVLLGLFTGATVGIFLLEMVQFYIHADKVPEYAVTNAARVGTIAILFFIVVSVSGLVTALTQVGNKKQRTAWLILPASNKEKFMSLVAHVTLVCPVVAIIGLILGDTLRMATEYLGSSIIEHPVNMVVLEHPYGTRTYYWWSSIVPDMIRMLTPDFVEDKTHYYTMGVCIMKALFQTSFFVWVHSLFTLGGTLLRKYAFAITGVLFIGCVAFLSWVFNTFDVSLFTAVWDGDRYVSQEVGTGAYVFTVLAFALAVLKYWLSFPIFKGFQVITNKWMNYDILKR